ncbi:aquaporin-11 [Synchiropus splendidus]|uniref:aquaporin-11 n=1 Tax=Synchiropus splendidus TaxID=270530 RepID=UPI00237D413A|nr:aquaporin-11 [Synchiropus splendidus]
MSADVLVSLAVVAGFVVASEGARRCSGIVLAGTSLSAYARELVCTFQLCCCTHELKLLSEVGGIAPRIALTFTYVLSVVHALTFRGAIANPSGALAHACRARLSRGAALRRVACQFAAAVAARAAVRAVWSLGWSALHARHRLLGYHCSSPIRVPLLMATLVELACAFAIQTAITHTRALEEKYRVHAVAVVITSTVYAGGSWTGAVSNPALAFSTQFPCSGSSFSHYCAVYCLGPLLGTSASVLLSDRVVPWLLRTPASPWQPESRKGQ